jgi:hypothetical protein
MKAIIVLSHIKKANTMNNNSKFRQLMTSILILLSVSLYSQQPRQNYNPETGFQKGQWVTGGNFGIGIGSGEINLGISPQIGYRITPKWEFGTRLTYNYYHYNYQGLKFSSHQFGGGFYTIYDIYAGLFAQAENELLSYEKIYTDSNNLDVVNRVRTTVHSIFVGGGYRQMISGKASISITILFNLNETIDSPYANPLFRIGFGFGL